MSFQGDDRRNQAAESSLHSISHIQFRSGSTGNLGIVDRPLRWLFRVDCPIGRQWTWRIIEILCEKNLLCLHHPLEQEKSRNNFQKSNKSFHVNFFRYSNYKLTLE